jgi:hypothetical protein
MTIKEQLHELLDELDDDSAGQALAYLQSRHGRYGAGGVRTDDAIATEQDAPAMDTWEDEGGGQAARAVDEPSSEPSRGRLPTPVRDDLDHLVDALDDESAVEALAYVETLRSTRLLSEAETEDEAATEEEHDAAVEAWQLDRRHALDER